MIQIYNNLIALYACISMYTMCSTQIWQYYTCLWSTSSWGHSTHMCWHSDPFRGPNHVAMSPCENLFWAGRAIASLGAYTKCKVSLKRQPAPTLFPEITNALSMCLILLCKITFCPCCVVLACQRPRKQTQSIIWDQPLTYTTAWAVWT